MHIDGKQTFDFTIDLEDFELQFKDGTIVFMEVENSRVRAVISYFYSACNADVHHGIVWSFKENIPWNMLKTRMKFELDSGMFLVDPHIIDVRWKRWEELKEVMLKKPVSRDVRGDIQSKMNKMMSEVWEQDMSRIHFARKYVDELINTVRKCKSYTDFENALPEIVRIFKEGGSDARTIFAKKYAAHCPDEILKNSIDVWSGKNDFE